MHRSFDNVDGHSLYDMTAFNTDGFVKRLENAIKFGQSVLFEGIDTELDPIIDPVLEKNITKEAGVEVIEFDKQKL